ncbi:uncharacterized protein LOC110176517 [Drosophila serrata]|uniref:uncharacterized protein LOC110176517 n=1 Tax=Drosophila serrata TaxID=7274 RepID=UPI000A1D0155|nr:uncharacterized protein LOC110176517 [Drosophila serrata]
MNLFTVLTFLFVLGSITCSRVWVETRPKRRRLCEEQANVRGKDLMNLDDMNVKCYYHCVYEMKGIILNGTYIGGDQWCEGIEDDNKCELARKIILCSMLKDK